TLYEVLLLIKGNNGEIPNIFKKLLPQLLTLYKRIRTRILIMNIRKVKIPVNILKILILPFNLKLKERRKIEILR
ncbi:hypothetical protein B0T20DRAFT_365278, partial [Sordaria brevicollis]